VPEDAARLTQFSGRVNQVRFWSKFLEEDEIRAHLKNYSSLGVVDPLTNFNFATTPSGSFERLRLDVSMDQPVTTSNDVGNAELFDFSQNEFHMSAIGFPTGSRIIMPERFDYSSIDPKFDEHSADNKIRIRGFQDYENVKNYGGEVSPVYEVRPSEIPHDDVRFSIDMSSVQALNEDIIKIFSTLDALDNALGAPELLFATEYPDLKRLRDVYFNRLEGKLQTKSFFEFFKWFDNSIGMIVEQLIPRKTKFLGMNFIIESHMLERAKFKYGYEDVYLGDNNRHGLKGTILLQQFIGQLRRY